MKTTTTTRPEITLGATPKAALAVMLGLQIHQRMFHLLWATHRSQSQRRITGATNWRALPYHTWERIDQAKAEACELFRQLRRALAPADYRAALATAKDIANETHTRWAQLETERRAASLTHEAKEAA